jgi:Fic family protein
LFFLSKGIDAHKNNYYKAFNAVEETNDLSYFIIYYYFLLQEE